MEKLRNKFPKARLFGGIAHIFSTLNEEGEVHHFNDIHSLTFGHLNKADERMEDDSLILVVLQTSQLSTRMTSL